MIKSALTETRIFDFQVITKIYIIMCLKFLHENWDSPPFHRAFPVMPSHSAAAWGESIKKQRNYGIFP